MSHTIPLNRPLRAIAAVFALLAVLGIVGDAMTLPRIGLMQVFWWGATVLGVWVLARAAWRGVLELGPGKTR